VNFVLLSLVLVFAIALYGLWSRRLAGQSDRRLSQGAPEQEFGASHSPIVVRGEISAGNASTSAWTVELTPLRVGVTRKATPGQDGFFEFLAVTPCEHELRVIDAEGRMRYHDVFRLRLNHETLAISVPSAEPVQYHNPTPFQRSGCNTKSHVRQ